MATITSAQSGNWSDTATWVGGVVPISTDDVVIGNGHVVQLNVDVTVLSIKTTFGSNTRVVVSDSKTITTTGDGIQGVGGGANGFIEITAGTGEVVNINGDIRAGGNFSIGSVNVVGGCTVNMNGTFYGGFTSVSGSYGYTIAVRGSGATLNITGVFIGSNGANPKPAVYATNSANKIINASGSFTADLSSCISSESASDIITVDGVLVSSSNSVVVSAANGALVRLGDVDITNTSDVNAVFASKIRFINLTDDAKWTFNTDTIGSDKIIYTASLLTGYPLEEDVEDGVIYGPSNEYEGTLEPVIIDTAQLASDLLDDIQTSSHVVAQRLRAASTDDSVGSIVTSTLGAP